MLAPDFVSLQLSSPTLLEETLVQNAKAVEGVPPHVGVSAGDHIVGVLQYLGVYDLTSGDKALRKKTGGLRDVGGRMMGLSSRDTPRLTVGGVVDRKAKDPTGVEQTGVKGHL